jgi:hypothetical protein
MPSLSPSPQSPARAGIELECPVLLDRGTPQLYRTNAFRILGLPVDAGIKEISRAVDMLQKKAEFGGPGGLQQTHSCALTPPPALEEIRDAAQRLKEPEQRLIDEFFHFWPVAPKSVDDPAIQSIQRGDTTAALASWTTAEPDSNCGFIARHNTAVLFHLSALDWSLHHLEFGLTPEEEGRMVQYWQDAFERWEALAGEPRVWDRIRERITALDDPRLTTGFARRMEAVFPLALDRINAELALEYARRGEQQWAQWHVDFMRRSHAGLDDTAKVASLVLKPTRERVLRVTQTAKEASEKNPREGDEIVVRMIDECEPLLFLFDLFHGSDAYQRTELFDDVARAGNLILCGFVKETKNEDLFAELEERLLAFATSIDVRNQLQQNISSARSEVLGKVFEPLYAELKLIQELKSWSSLRYERLRKKVLARLPDMLTQVGPAEVASKQLCDACAIVLRGILLQAANEEKHVAFALELAEIAEGLASDDKLRKTISSEREMLCSMAGRGKCDFCKSEEADPRRMVKIPMHKVSAYTGNGVQFIKNTFTAPRCRKCAKIHEPYRAWAAWAALAGAVVAPLAGPAAFGAGFSTLMCLFGGAICYTALKTDLRAALFGLMFFFGGFAGFRAVTVSEFGGFVILQSVGGAVTAASIAFAAGWIYKESQGGTLKNHQKFAQLKADGFVRGEKPAGFS